MAIWTRVRHIWNQLVAGRQLDVDLDDELVAYVDLLTAERVRAGQDPLEARRAALIEAGGVEQLKEQVRDARTTSTLDALRQDLRYGVRQLLRAPGFTGAALLALALGIGATAATFSVVDAVLLRPLAYDRPDELHAVMHQRDQPASPINYFAWKRQAASFAAMEAAEWWMPNLVGEGDPEKLYGLRVTPGMFELLGVPAARGRTLLAGSDELTPEVVIGHGLWLRRFGGDESIVGRAVRLDGRTYTVVGVMPSTFQFAPFWATRAELWAPLPLAERAASNGQSLRLFARLADGVSRDAAADEMAAITTALEAERPGTNRDVTVTPLHELAVGDARQSILVVFVAVGFVLLVACANVAHMLLARATAREKEVAVRAALGAGRRRLIRQFVTESLLLSIAGGAAGAGLAYALVGVVRSLAASALPRTDLVSIDSRVLLFAVGVSILTGLLFGLAPILKLSKPNLSAVLGEAGRGTSAARRTRRARGALMASEVALAIILLIGAGLTLRSFAGLRAVDPGWNPDPILSMIVSVAGTAEASPGRRTAFYDQLVEAVDALPGASGATFINHLPLAGDIWTLPLEIEGRPEPPPGEGVSAAYRVVYPDYFETMDVSVVRGRGIDTRDRLEAPGVAVINEHLATTTWAGDDPIGKRLKVAGSDWLTVVGIAENAFLYDWAAPPSNELYVAYRQTRMYREDPAEHAGYLTLIARADDPAALEEPIRRVVRELAPDVTVSAVLPMGDVVAGATSGARFLMALLGAFAAIALVLAAVGVYGVTSYDVAGRRREIGIRLAMGAAPRQVVLQVVGRGMLVVLAGAMAGVAGAYALSGLLAGSLFGIEPTDPVVFVSVPAALGAVALVASAIPSWRASRVSPMAALGE